MKFKLQTYLVTIIIFVVLYNISLNNYLLFHSLAEIFSVCIAFTIFVIAINSKEFNGNNFLVVIGIAYLFIGFLDLLHTLSYVGMNIFTDYDYYANQLWIGTRFMESLTLLVSFAAIRYKKKLNTNLILIIYFTVTATIILSVFYWKIFPICFVLGEGLTEFKIISEYVISTILVASLGFAHYYREYFDKILYRYILLSILFTIFSEILFTFYISNYGLSNMFGHFFKIVSFYFIYRAIIENVIKDPQNLIFRELQKQVNIDGLTGLFNHRYLFDTLQDEINRTNRTKTPFSIVIFDLDHFKRINDEFGHVVGDEVLVCIGNIIKSLTRVTDIVGRYGGEEFMLILPNTEKEGCYHIAEKIRNEIEKNDCLKKGIKSVKGVDVTISGGIAQYSEPYIKGQVQDISLLARELVNAADINLYKAKTNGRNRIVGLEK